MVIFRIECELNGRKLRVYTNGKIESFYWNKWYEVKGCTATSRKYTNVRVVINYKLYKKHRVIYWAWNSHKFDINDPKQEIDHINRIPTDNRLCNLDVVSGQQNHFNTDAKGYCWSKTSKKWVASIRIKGIANHLGYFGTEYEARNAYMEAKKELHLIPNRVWG